MTRRIVWILTIALLAISADAPAAAYVPAPLARLTAQLRTYVRHAPGRVALDVIDLSSGYAASYDAGASMPAASTIKIPVMVEVFAQLQNLRFDLAHRVSLRASDKDWGSGELCDAPVGASYSVADLLDKMIDISDNTATNMLIRLVGRSSINATMRDLGLRRTRLTSDIRSDGASIRYALRSSPSDMAVLLARMARDRLIDSWSSEQMISILEGQEHNTLIPQPLPGGLTVAHKTGTLHDTLNDVGIVYVGGAPYVIAVMATNLPTLSGGRRFIRGVSRVAFQEMHALANWREAAGMSLDSDPTLLQTLSPDVAVWVGNSRE